MALEIERRFLVRGELWRPHAVGENLIRQGYLASGRDDLTLRVRLARPRRARWRPSSPSSCRPPAGA